MWAWCFCLWRCWKSYTPLCLQTTLQLFPILSVHYKGKSIWYQFCTSTHMNRNLDKSKVFVFRNGGILKQTEQWYYKWKQMETVPFYKYLGLYITSTLETNIVTTSDENIILYIPISAFVWKTRPFRCFQFCVILVLSLFYATGLYFGVISILIKL